MKPAILCLLTALSLAATATPSDAQDPRFVPGYERRTAGEVLSYHSPQPEADRALLVRSLDAERFIEWETAPVPEDPDGDRVTFVWLFGIDANGDAREFALHVDGKERLRFRNPAGVDERNWAVAGEEGVSLRFHGTWADRHDDLFGYAFLELPRSACRTGEPVRLKVVGESAGSRTWYMTFQHPVMPRASLVARSAVVRSEEGEYQPLVLDLVHLGAPKKVDVVTSLGDFTVGLPLRLGSNRVELRHPVVSEPQEVRVRVLDGDEELYSLAHRVDPVREWTIHLVQHTHTDIGYTRPQTEILPEHLRFIDYTLDYCDRTDDYPDDAKFRWTCEATWPVREWLRSRPASQIERLRRRCAEGRIEVTGMFGNMSELTDEASYFAFLQPIREIREAGIAVTTAMQNDVNGIGWCLADYFPEIGIEYVDMGQHGHRALIPFDKATAFWWESPAGSRVLAFRADHYMTGNMWGVHTGRLETTEDALLAYLGGMEEKGHPFDEIAVQYSGFFTDNSPPAITPCDLIREWNEKYRWPRLRSSVAREFLRSVKENHADELPVHRVAWPDWWTDGFGSAAREAAATRVTQDEMLAVEGLLAMAELSGIEVPPVFLEEVEEIRDCLIFYGEHTFGAAESIRDPLCENSMVQWAEKSAYAWEAVKHSAILREKALGLFQPVFAQGDTPRIVVVNTLGIARSGWIDVYVDHDIAPADARWYPVDGQGRRHSVVRVSSRPDGTTWSLWAEDVPAFGYRTYSVVLSGDASAVVPRPQPPGMFLNRWYDLELDPETGGVVSLVDRELAYDLVDENAEWPLGQLVLESLGNRSQMEGFRLDDYERTSVVDVTVGEPVWTPDWVSIEVTGTLPGAGGPQEFRREIRIYHGEKRVDFLYSIRLARSTEPEAIYVAFPFAFPDAEVAYEILGGVAVPGENLLPGTASDWQTVQGFATVRCHGGQIVLSSPEIPLMQFGGIQTGRYEPVARVEQPHVYSWVTNNYWTTNFRASQEGELTWSYRLTSSDDASGEAAWRFGQGRVPFLSRVLPAGGTASRPVEDSVLSAEGSGVILVSSRPAPGGEGVLLCFREVNGRPSSLTLTSPAGRTPIGSVHASNVLGEELTLLSGPIPFAPFQSRFLLVR